MKQTYASALAALPWAWAAFSSGTKAPAQTPRCPATSSHISMESGVYSSGPGVEFALHHFVATLVPQGRTVPS